MTGKPIRWDLSCVSAEEMRGVAEALLAALGEAADD